MTLLALGLILVAAVAHVTWNLLLKETENKELFAWWFSLAAGIVLAPLGIFLFLSYPIETPGYWFIPGAMVLQCCYLVLLGRAYARGDISLVYPIARGTGPMLVPVLAVLTLGDSIAVPAVAGIVLVVVGIYTVSWWGNFREIVRNPLSFFRNSGALYALLTGCTITIYSLWDSRAVQYVSPFLYMYLLVVGVGVLLAPYIFRTYPAGLVWRTWTQHWWAILVAGIMSYMAYACVLTAFTLSPVGYVVPAREVSIVVTVIAGVVILKEPFGRGRLIGSCLIVLGLFLIALSP